MGPQGSGKSTQAKLLAEKLGVPHLSTGDLCRRLRKEDSPLGRLVKGYYDRGEFVSDRDVLQILEEELIKPQYASGLVLDGFPRNIWQAENAPFEVDRVFYLAVSDDESLLRLSKRAKFENRADDTDDAISRRLELYHSETEPVLDFYRPRGILKEIDGERPIEEISENILRELCSDL